MAERFKWKTGFRLYDAYRTKTQAKAAQEDLKKQGVQYVRIRTREGHAIPYEVYIGGKNSRSY